MRNRYKDREENIWGFHPLTFVIGSVAVLLTVGLSAIVYNSVSKGKELKIK